MKAAKKNGHSKKTALSLYRSYNFVDKDPVIDRIRTIVQDEGLNYKEIGTISGVSASTLTNWFEGETKRPQYATIAAVTYSLGYKQEFVKSKELDFKKELAKAQKEILERGKSK
jgi:transcriptional regulator with XRE-family HTH domain